MEHRLLGDTTRRGEAGAPPEGDVVVTSDMPLIPEGRLGAPLEDAAPWESCRSFSVSPAATSLAREGIESVSLNQGATRR